MPHGAKSAGIRAAATALTAALTASQLQDAYGITNAASSDGTGQTVAVVDAYRDPTIVDDLAKYRLQNNLPACDSSTGAGCLTVYDQNGTVIDPATATSPRTPPDTTSDDEMGWENETALDVDMISAICPNCKIALFEANSANLPDLGPAENSAAKVANFISNSWSGTDYPGESVNDDTYFNHPGKAIAFASGDFGYGATYPSSSQFVTSVGGTYLDQPSAGTWTQTVWNDQEGAVPADGTAAGCSTGEPKAAWQTDTGCANRTQNDVSAVASSPYGIGIVSSMVDSVDSLNSCGGPCAMIGTSVATPIITSMYALAGTPSSNTYPTSYLYQDPAGLAPITSGTDVIKGSPLKCESNRQYLCNAADRLTNGYNGPAGLGTPTGDLSPFKNTATGDVVSVANPGDYGLQTGVSYSLPAIQAIDSASGQTLTYSQTGLPNGLSIDSATGAISGTVPSAVTGTVHVTVKDGTGANSTVSFRITAVPSLTSAYHPAPGPVTLKLGGKCLDDTANRSTAGNKIEIWTCNGLASQKWTFYPNTDPANALVDLGTMQIHGMCMDLVDNGTANGTKIQLSTCNGGASQQWGITGGDGQLYNVAAQRCLDDTARSTTNGTQVEVWDCNFGSNQNWQLPPSPVENGVLGKCLDDTANRSANGTKIESWSCNGMGSQRWQFYPDGTIRIHGKCLNAVGNGTTIGTRIQLYSCGSGSTTYTANYWYLTAWGQIENAQAEKCLVIPGNSSANGAPVELSDCTVQPSEIWAAS